MDFPGGSDGKASVYNAGDPGSSPGLGRSPGKGNGNPFQYCCLENPMDRGAWQAAVYGVAKSRTWLSDFTSLTFPKDKPRVFYLFNNVRRFMVQEPITQRGTLDYWVSLGNYGRLWIMGRCNKCLATLATVMYSYNVAFDEVKKFMDQCLRKGY